MARLKAFRKSARNSTLTCSATKVRLLEREIFIEIGEAAGVRVNLLTVSKGIRVGGRRVRKSRRIQFMGLVPFMGSK